MPTLYGQIFNIQHFSTEDGPGIRTTVFLKGCPLRCVWCANPESQQPQPQLAWRSAPCIGCRCCVKSCEKSALCASAQGLEIDRSLCDGCGDCVKVCPSGAMQFYGRRLTLEETLEEVLRDQGYYAQSGGGMTISGGECTAQPEFTAALLQRCREAGIHTAVDTCGFVKPELLEQLACATDLFLYDIKHMDEQEHIRYTGVSNKLILENLKCLSQRGAHIFIRIPIIPGVNDSDESLRAAARFAAALPHRHHVDLLPYHNFGVNKYHMLGMPYVLESVKKPDEAHKRHYLEIFREFGLDCTMH